MNKIIITGRLGRDPEERVAGNGSVVSFSVAVNEYDYAKKERVTMWVRVSTWLDRQKKFAMGNLSKGSAVEVSGSLQFDSDTGSPKIYERNSEPATSFDVRADDINFAPSSSGEDKGYSPKASNNNGKYMGGTQKATSNVVSMPTSDVDDGEIVF